MAAVASPPMSPPQRPMSPNSVTSDDADEELDLLDFLQEGPQATTEVSLSRLHLRERDDDASSKGTRRGGQVHRGPRGRR